MSDILGVFAGGKRGNYASVFGVKFDLRGNDIRNTQDFFFLPSRTAICRIIA